MDDGFPLAQAERQVSLPALRRWQRAANYLAAAQIYLQDNCLLEEPLRPEHVKERLLGHWGTCPGLNLVHAHLNRLVIERDAEVLLVTGPGHGAAATLANLYLDGSLAELYPEYARDRDGLVRFVRAFGSPGGFPSRLSPLVPGVIHDGGERGSALATAFGAALDAPDLLVVCVVGDGEAESGAAAAAWHGTKFLDPATSGAVLPILHLNGYKRSSPTIYGTMSDHELGELFAGLGWEPLVVQGPEYDADLANAFDVAWHRIRGVRESPRRTRPRWPAIVLRTPKGLSGPSRVDGHPVEGSFRSHGVPARELRTNPRHLADVEAWLRSYRPEELWDEDGRPIDLDEASPYGERRIAVEPHARRGGPRASLELPQLADFELALEGRGSTVASATGHAAVYLRDVLRASERERSFRIVSPDELESSLLGAVLQATGRAYTWPVDHDDVTLRPDGRVMEVLDAGTCLGWLQGYLQTGRHGLFVGCVDDASVAAYARWLEASQAVAFRAAKASLNCLVVGTLRGGLAQGVRILLPPDANTLLATLDRCLRTTDQVNLVVASAEELPQWLPLDEAVAHCVAGASVWTWAGAGDQDEPAVVLVCAGMTATREVLAAARILREELPALSFRVVNVVEPAVLAEDAARVRLFGDAPLVVAADGEPAWIEGLLRERPALTVSAGDATAAVLVERCAQELADPPALAACR